ncbi:MAG TPA: hypothetical protein VEU96_21550 [Bryobacteraceae bacterium]|nr:hypothetical protein [Bryobacteraceae bacterium]
MDTRSKIVARAEAHRHLGAKAARWVSGHFDPLLAAHVRRLRHYSAEGQSLVVEITNPPKPLLSAQARAELVAALSMVDYVILPDGPSTSEPINDAPITAHFIDHVRTRHQLEAKQ